MKRFFLVVMVLVGLPILSGCVAAIPLKFYRRKEKTMCALKILFVLISLIVILPVCAATQTTEKKPPSGLCGDPRLTGTCEEIERRLKKEGIYTSIDWQIIPSPLGGLDILGKSKVDVDLSDDTTARLYIATARDVALLRMGSHKPKFIQVYLYSPRGPQDKYYINAFLDFDRGTSTYRNYAADYVAQKKTQEEVKLQQQKNIDKYIVPFMKRHNVGTWFNQRSPVAKQLFANPYSLKGKAVGFIGKFGSMASENSGYFWIGHEGGTFGSPLPPVVLKKIPSSKFVSPGEKFAIVARVEGVTSISVPSFGQIPTVEMIFVATEEPFPNNYE